MNPRFALVLLILLGSIAVAIAQSTKKLSVRATTLCTSDERIVFSCKVRRGAKIVSLCSSKQLDKEHGYLQYRFGLPGRIELEFPKDLSNTQAQFRYSHYFRYQVDLTEINFNIDGYEYQVFDSYNGEEKRKLTEEGVSVTAPGRPKQVLFVCDGKPRADYSSLEEALSSEQP